VNKWFVVHSLESFEQNPRLVGFSGKTDLDGKPVLDRNKKPVPFNKNVKRVKLGDQIVYYCKIDYVVKGVFEVVESVYDVEPQWRASPFQFRIKPVFVPAKPLDFKSLVFSPDIKLDMFKKLDDLKRWGSVLQGQVSALKPLTEHDFNSILNALKAKPKKAPAEEEPLPPEYKFKHADIQHKIAELGMNKYGYRVHVGISDKSKIGIPGLLGEIPQFHSEDVVSIAKWIDVVFFDKERDLMRRAFEIEHSTSIYSGLLRLNDMASSILKSEEIRFFIVAPKNRIWKFEQQLARPSFKRLADFGCTFVSYEDVEEEWRNMKKQKPGRFR